MSKKYLVKPGHIRSQSDGDTHYISFSQLVGLYRVKAYECINYELSKSLGYTPDYFDNLIVLEPRFDGNYDLATNSDSKEGQG